MILYNILESEDSYEDLDSIISKVRKFSHFFSHNILRCQPQLYINCIAVSVDLILHLLIFLFIFFYVIYLWLLRIYSFSFTGHPGLPRLALLPADDQLLNNKILLLYHGQSNFGKQRVENVILNLFSGVSELAVTVDLFLLYTSKDD